MSQDVIKVKDLTVSFTDRSSSYEVIQRISFDVAKDQFVSIIGRTGCGKTTLLKIIGGLITQQQGKTNIEGEIKVLGNYPSVARLNRKIGMVTQQPRLFPWMTVQDNITFPLKIMRRKNLYESPEKMLSTVGMKDHKNNLPHNLSGGEKQLVALVRALIYSPSILLLDEPFGSLDAITREELSLVLMSTVKNFSATTILITHDLREALFLSDKIIILAPSPTKSLHGPQTIIKQIFEVPFPKDRNLELKKDAEFSTLEMKLKKFL